MCNIISIFTGRGRKRTGTSPARAVERVATPKPIKIRMSPPKPEPESAPTIAEVAETAAEPMADTNGFHEVRPWPMAHSQEEAVAILDRAYGDYIRRRCESKGYDPIDVLAVIMKESGGLMRFGDRLPAVRVELHHVEKYLDDDDWAVYGEYFTRTNPTQAWLGHKYDIDGDGPEPARWLHPADAEKAHAANEWALDKLSTIAGEGAYLSASYGPFQIMGFNFKALGYPSAKAMWEAFIRSDKAMIDGFFAFVDSRKGAGAALKRRNEDGGRATDWLAFAKAYNGPGDPSNYAAGCRAWRRIVAKVLG